MPQASAEGRTVTAPPRLTGLPGTWRHDWALAVARARSVYAIPSRYPLASPTPRPAEMPGENKRRALAMEDLGIA